MATDKMSRHNVEQIKCATDKMPTDKMSNKQNVGRKKNSLADWKFSWTTFYFFSKVVKTIFRFLVFEIWSSLGFFPTKDMQTPPP